MADDRLADLKAEWDKAKAGADDEVADAPGVEVAQADDGDSGPVESAPADDGETAGAGEEKEKPAADGRDDKGRFAAKALGSAEAKPAKGAQAAQAAPKTPPDAAQAQPVTPTAPATKPPQSWSHAERQAWDKLPPEAQRAVMRREQETAQVLQQNAQLRRSYEDAGQRLQQVESFVRPYEAIWRSQGMDPMQGAASVVQTYAALHLGSQQQRDAILAGLVNQFGSLDGINAHLQGQAPAPQQFQPPRQTQQPAPQPQDPRAIFREEMERFRAQAVASKADQEFQAFQASNPEFLEEPGVWETMQAALDADAARGRGKMTYQQAYDLAVQMDPEIQTTLRQRAAAAAVTSPSATAPTARTKAASATIRPKPTSIPGAGVNLDDRRAMLQAEWDARNRE